MAQETAGEPSFGHIARQMGKMMDQMQRGYSNYLPNETWTPAVNLYESDAAYLVCVDLSGVDKEKTEVTVAEGRLKLRGHREVPTLAERMTGHGREERMRVHLMEIDHGAFCREVELPRDVSVEGISANYVSGMLWVELPKK